MSLLVLLVVVVVLVALASRGARLETKVRAPAGDALAAALRRAVEAGVLSDAQREAVLANERAAAPVAPGEARTPRFPPVLEALGYLGAIFVMVGGVTLVARFWDDLPTWSRLTILGGVAAALTGAGLAVRDESEAVLWRLRGVLLFLGSAALGGFTGLLAVDGFDWRDEPVAVLIGTAVAAHAGLLWWRKDRPLQHAATLAGILVAVIAALNWAGGREGVIGVTLWALGGAWLVASYRRLLPPALVGMAIGAALTLIGAGVTGGQWQHFGVLFGLVSTALLVAGGIRRDEFLVTAIGVLGAFVFLPATVNTFFGGTIGVPAAMLLSGLALLAVTVRLLRHRGGGSTPTGIGRLPRPRHA